MSLEMDLDLTGIDLDEADKGMTPIPAGWYRAVVGDLWEDHKNPGTLAIEFVMDGGPFDGRKLTERLFDPANSQDAEKAKTTAKRRGIFALRLGLVSREQSGQVVRPDWSKAIGRECIVKIVHRKYKDDAGNEREGAQLDFAGVFSTTDERAPEALRDKAAGGVAASNGAAAAATPANSPELSPSAPRTHGPTPSVAPAIDYSTL